MEKRIKEEQADRREGWSNIVRFRRTLMMSSVGQLRKLCNLIRSIDFVNIDKLTEIDHNSWVHMAYNTYFIYTYNQL